MDTATDTSVHNVRSANYIVAETLTNCWKCKKPTKVYSIMLPENHQILEWPDFYEDDDDTDTSVSQATNIEPTKEWTTAGGRRVYYNLQCVNALVLKELSNITQHKYRMDRYKGRKQETLINHCQHCDAKHSEKELNNPSDSADQDNYPFAFITHSQPPEEIFTRTVHSPFEAHGTKWIMYSGIIVEGRISP